MRKISGTIAALLFLVTFCSPPALRAAAPLEVDKMKAALQTATPEENGFIEKVSELVVQDRLPRKLVDSTFLWARKKPQYKFQYFKLGLKVRAAKLGIEL